MILYKLFDNIYNTYVTNPNDNFTDYQLKKKQNNISKNIFYI